MKDNKHCDAQKKRSSYELGRNDGRASMKMDILYVVRSCTGRDLTLNKLVKAIEDLE